MRFRGLLRSLAENVAAPPEARLRILQEVEADLEDLYAALRATGLTEREARSRAARLLVPDHAAVAALARVHRPLWMRWRDRYGGIEHGGERLLLGAGGLLAVGMAVGALIRTGLWAGASPFVLAPLSIGALALLQGVAKAVRVWGAGESAAVRIRTGSGLLLLAAAGALVATAFGVLYELAATAAAIHLAPAREFELLLAWLRRSVLLGVLGISVSLMSGLSWLLFMHYAAVVEEHERAVLGPPLQQPGRSQYQSTTGGS